MMNHARYIPSWVDSGATFIWINDVLQGKSERPRSDVFWQNDVFLEKSAHTGEIFG